MRNWKKFFIREKVIKAIRVFFQQNNFHEVETPLLVPWLIPESHLNVFETYLKDRQGKKKKMYLTASPEASIKKLLVAGIGNCFEITKSFRNCETGSHLHNPEFTILEWYRIRANYKDVMKDCEDLIIHIHKELIKHPRGGRMDSSGVERSPLKKSIKYQGQLIDLTPPWERISIEEAFKKYAKISFAEITEMKNNGAFFPVEKIARIAKNKGYKIEKHNTWEEIFHQIFLNEIEPHLGTHGRPTIIYDYPRPLAALSKIKKDDSRFAERFEFYIGGLELGDCYTELTNWQEQEKRFKEEAAAIKKLAKTPITPDKDFLEALKIGLPDCSGIAVGVDRLVMLFTDAKTIEETLLFPISEMIEI